MHEQTLHEGSLIHESKKTNKNKDKLKKTKIIKKPR